MPDAQTGSAADAIADAPAKPLAITSWVLQVIIIAILAMAAFPSRALFEGLGAEPAGRYAVGIIEIIAIVLLLIPKTAVYGGIVAALAMLGAIGSHVTRLGVSIDAEALGQPEALASVEGPAMFGMAVVVLLASLGVVFIRRGQLPIGGGASAASSAS